MEASFFKFAFFALIGFAVLGLLAMGISVLLIGLKVIWSWVRPRERTTKTQRA